MVCGAAGGGGVLGHVLSDLTGAPGRLSSTTGILRVRVERGLGEPRWLSLGQGSFRGLHRAVAEQRVQADC